MADVDINNKRGRHANKSAAKKFTRVDLTPMVDLGFLLITFFVFTTTMARSTVMEIKTPYGSDPGDPVCNSCALTVLLGKNNVIYYYEGDFETATLRTANYNSIRDIIQMKKQKLRLESRNDEQFSLIIKACDSSSFKNFVDITD